MQHNPNEFMKKILFSGLLALFTVLVYGQQETPAAYELDENFNFWHLQPGDTAYVFADVAYVRDYPSTSSALIDSVRQGQRVIISSEGYNSSLVRGYSAPWHQVSYEVNGRHKQGFIWLGLLAIGAQGDAMGNQFLYGLLRKNPGQDEYSNGQYRCGVKYLSADHALIGQIIFPHNDEGQGYTEAKLLGNMGLSGLQAIYRVGFYGEACGVPTIHTYLGWDGQQFINMLSKTSVGDAGVYYYEEKVLFPVEHKLQGDLVIKDIIQGEVIDLDAVEPEIKETSKREKYRWENKQLIQIVEKK